MCGITISPRLWFKALAHILLVEDNEDLLETLADWLRYEGHSVQTASDGIEASTVLKTGVFDILLLDWLIPGKSGLELSKEYRMSGGRAPIIMLTGRSSMDNQERGFDAGVDHYLVKPFNLKELSWRVRACLRRSLDSFPVVLAQNSEKQRVTTNVCKTCGATYDTTISVCFNDATVLQEESVEFFVGSPLSESYVIAGVLGRGATGTVFKAWHKKKEKVFALKLLDKTHISDATRVRRFQHEGDVLKKLEHPNIIHVHDVGVSSAGQPYLVMDYVEGRSLAGLLAKKNDTMPFKQMISINRQICEGMAHAHKMGVIHRDLKPANILLHKGAREEQVHIVDFGVAMVLSQEKSLQQLQLTGTGEILGTVLYMSPEQCMGQELDARSDIYSLGCIMYEMISGHPPLAGRNVLETLHLRINDTPPKLSTLRTDVPAAIEKIVHKSIARDQSARFDSMESLQKSLAAAIKEI